VHASCCLFLHVFLFVCVLCYSICVGGTLGAFSLDFLKSIIKKRNWFWVWAPTSTFYIYKDLRNYFKIGNWFWFGRLFFLEFFFIN
jgi:hypothetical protein